MSERLIVTLTSYGQRLHTLPVVLDSIYAQSVPPDKVVLNLARDESIPDEVQQYIDGKGIEIFYTKNTKVYKKLIPTLRRYPNDLVMSIDDDWIYPKEMIEEFLDVHKRYPNHPVSGNHYVEHGMACHCGCASLTKAKFMGDFLNTADCDELVRKCPCDDIAYTFFSVKSGFPYVRTVNEYSFNMEPAVSGEGYSAEMNRIGGIDASMKYLVEKYGELPPFASAYVDDPSIARILDDIHLQQQEAARKEIRATARYRLGNVLLAPSALLKRLRRKKS